jgi:SAM-dependent methyltransferase
MRKDDGATGIGRRGVLTHQRVGRLPMGEGASERDPVAGLIESQREFYDLRAPDFGDETVPDRRVSGYMASDLGRALIDEFAPTGDVLELACGNGGFTRELVRHARTVTAIDASPRMLERNRREVGDSSVTYVSADIFDWQPDRRYDAVFFGFWLSHVRRSPSTSSGLSCGHPFRRAAASHSLTKTIGARCAMTSAWSRTCPSRHGPSATGEGSTS